MPLLFYLKRFFVIKQDNANIDIKLMILDEINKRNVNSPDLIDEKRKMYYNINCANNIILR